MPIKTTKKTSTKVSGNSDVKLTTKKSESSTDSKKKTTKTSSKAVVKRRTSDLTPTKASAVAIASQAHRAQKQALLEKMASEDKPKQKNQSSTKIPLRVRIFFGCSLLLFCISFYKAIIRPQLEIENLQQNSEQGTYRIDSNNSDLPNNDSSVIVENPDNENVSDDNVRIETPQTAPETIQVFFDRLSNREFDESFDLLIPALQRSSEMRNHFTAFRMTPFLEGIEGGKLVPTNFKYISTSTYGRDRYSFDISYVLSSTQDQYDETWEAVVDTTGDNPKITSIVCTTSKCSYHPIFRPENFGLMR